MDSDDLYERTKKLALRVMTLVDALPGSYSGRAIAGQLVRSGMSVGANYRAARLGRSRMEFIAKLGVVREEADESAYWLELVVDGALLKPDQVEPLLHEARQLTAIFTSSIQSAKKNTPPSTRKARTAQDHTQPNP